MMRHGAEILFLMGGLLGLTGCITAFQEEPIRGQVRFSGATVSLREGAPVELDVVETVECLHVAEGQIWKRGLSYINHSSQTQDVTGITFHFEVENEGEAWRSENFWMGKTTDHQHAVIGYWCEAEFHRIASRQADGVSYIDINVEAAWRLAPGETATAGEAILALRENCADEAFKDTALWWFEHVLNLKPPVYPEWLRGSILYEACAGGHVESRFCDTGGFDAFAKQVPYLADMGINLMWLNAVHKHKNTNPQIGWNHYSPIDFTKIDPILGGDAGLKRLMDTFEKSDMHVLGGVVPHGGESIQAQALKEWASRNADGTLVGTWGSLCIDYSCPPWQDVIASACAQMASFGMEGVRIDVSDPIGINWSSPRSNHVSYSMLGGSLELQKKIIEQMQAAGIETPVLIPESLHNRPEYSQLPALGYGINFIFKLNRAVNAHRTDPAELNREIKAIIEDTLWSKPPGFLLIWALNNHDMLIDHARMQPRLGSGLFRALYSICVALPGVPMLYQEDEIGSYDFIRNIHWARRLMPEFHSDEFDLDAVYMDRENGRVFTVLRSDGTNDVAVLVNLSPERVTGRVSIQPLKNSNPWSGTLYDVVSGGQVTVDGGEFDYVLEPYGVAILTPSARRADAVAQKTALPPAQEINDLSMAEEAGVAQLRSGGVTLTLNRGLDSVVREPGQVRVALAGGETPRIRIDGSARWQVSTRSALLSDRTLRRHYPFPDEANYEWKRTDSWGLCGSGALYNGVAPLGRLWQSIFEPLHPQEPSLYFYDETGRGFEVVVENSSAENLVLTDRTDELSGDDFALELRFYSTDPDLSDRVRHHGFSPAFVTENSSAEAPSRPVALELVIRPFVHSSETAHAPRMEYADLYTREVLTGDGFDIPIGDMRIKTPSRVEWTTRAIPAGTYRLRIEAKFNKHWKTNPYDVDLAGIPLAMEWEKPDGEEGYGVLLSAPVVLAGEQPIRVGLSTTADDCAIQKPMRWLKQVTSDE